MIYKAEKQFYVGDIKLTLTMYALTTLATNQLILNRKCIISDTKLFL